MKQLRSRINSLAGCHPPQKRVLSDYLIRAMPQDATEELLQVANSFVVKDNFDIAGWPTTAGSAALADAPQAACNAEAVQRLLNGGHVLHGRTTMHELAFGVTGINSYAGTPCNPNYPALIPGGSSSGSAAAVASGHIGLAIGTDTGGSVRVPAACCGVVGLKPTFGRINRHGVLPAQSTLDCVGLFARNVPMIEQAMGLLADGWNRAKQTPKPRVALVEAPCDPAIFGAVRSAAAIHGEVADVRLDHLDAAYDAGLTLIAYETWQAFGALVKTGLLGTDVRDRLVAASRTTKAQCVEAEAVRERFRAEIETLLAEFDALVLPTLPVPIPSLAEAADVRAMVSITRFCRPFNLSGHPAISIPIGEIEGRPVSLQLIGRLGADEQLCALARHYPLFERGNDKWTL